MLNEIKSIVNEIKKYENIFILGSGKRAQALAKFLNFCNINIKAYISFKGNNLNIKNFSPISILTMNKKNSLILTEKNYEVEDNTFRRVQTIRIEVEKDCKLTKVAVSLFRTINKIKLMEIQSHIIDQIQAKMTPKKPENLGLELHLADHCNLKCQMCTHFSPIAKEGYYNLEQYKKDMKRLSELFNGKIGYLDLMGGEPLLNKNVIEYLKITRKCFPTSNIFLHSNGILMLKAENWEYGNFWQACKDYNIKLYSTEYPINIDYEAIKAKAKEYDVPITIFVEAANTKSKAIKVSSKEPLDINGKTDKEEFIICYRLNTCINLKDGKMYPCPTVAYINAFNDYFGQNLKVTEKDYIDIYKARSAEEICEFVAQRFPFCDYCRYSQATYGHEWKPSTKQMSEWVIDENIQNESKVNI